MDKEIEYDKIECFYFLHNDKIIICNIIKTDLTTLYYSYDALKEIDTFQYVISQHQFEERLGMVFFLTHEEAVIQHNKNIDYEINFQKRSANKKIEELERLKISI